MIHGTGDNSLPATTLCLGYTSYRLETLPFVRNRMRRYQCIALEEPPTPGFKEMLRQELDIEEYLLLTDFGFPEFARQQCRLLQELYAEGKTILQVEPFLQELVNIHEYFAAGGSPPGIPKGTTTREVYDCEKLWTGRLLSFYQKSRSREFARIVQAVKDFSRMDAQKGRLRDEMRGQALQDLFRFYQSMYVEAGYIHFVLLKELYQRLPQSYSLQTFYSLQSFFKPRIGKRQILGPGDVLTLIYTWRPDYQGPRTDLLAAQSLIYNKIVYKEEIQEEPESCPHSRDEIQAVQLARSLDYEQCEELFQEIRHLPTAQAGEKAQAWLRRKRQ
ncbi:MAG: hypothetical protein ACLFPG_09215 [Desulfohalobiaceae bacterium]